MIVEVRRIGGRCDGVRCDVAMLVQPRAIVMYTTFADWFPKV
jgi:hypothetical protein